MKNIMHFLFLSCLKATELIEKKLHVELRFKEKLQLKLHKSMCKACRIYGDQSKLMDKAIKKRLHKSLNINIEEFKSEIKQKISEN